MEPARSENDETALFQTRKSIEECSCFKVSRMYT